MGTEAPFFGSTAAGMRAVKLTTHLHLLPRLRMSGVMPPPLRPLWRLQGQLYLSHFFVKGKLRFYCWDCDFLRKWPLGPKIQTADNYLYTDWQKGNTIFGVWHFPVALMMISSFVTVCASIPERLRRCVIVGWRHFEHYKQSMNEIILSVSYTNKLPV